MRGIGKIMRAPAVFAVVLLFMSTLWASAQEFPQLTGRVVDNAGLMSAAQTAALTEKLAAFEAQSSDQVVVATVPDLQGYEIADYANRLARHWALGQKDEDNGVLLLVARDERQVRIEVGYGLEGTLTDALSRLIIENSIIPQFRSGDFAGGISAGVDGILQVLSGDAAELQARAERNTGWDGETVDWLGMIVVGFILATAFGPMLMMLVARLTGQKMPVRRGRARRRGPGGYWGGFPGGYGGGRSSGGGFSGGGFSGGGGSFGGGGASGSW